MSEPWVGGAKPTLQMHKPDISLGEHLRVHSRRVGGELRNRRHALIPELSRDGLGDMGNEDGASKDMGGHTLMRDSVLNETHSFCASCVVVEREGATRMV